MIMTTREIQETIRQMMHDWAKLTEAQRQEALAKAAQLAANA
jgi:hypothetical protein